MWLGVYKIPEPTVVANFPQQLLNPWCEYVILPEPCGHFGTTAAEMVDDIGAVVEDCLRRRSFELEIFVESAILVKCEEPIFGAGRCDWEMKGDVPRGRDLACVVVQCPVF